MMFAAIFYAKELFLVIEKHVLASVTQDIGFFYSLTTEMCNSSKRTLNSSLFQGLSLFHTICSGDQLYGQFPFYRKRVGIAGVSCQIDKFVMRLANKSCACSE